jgi:membrane associated rhomboid family serine protease
MMAGNDIESEWVAVLRSRSYERCADRAFVLLALGIPCEWGLAGDGRVLLAVPASEAPRALREIVLFDGEEEDDQVRPSPAPDTPGAVRRGARAGAMLYVVTILLFAFAQTRYLGGHDWLDAGRMQAGFVRAGEWWRTVTALTLHLDTPHLLGNLIFGAFFGYLASVMIGGAALAWPTVLAAGAGGNLLNAWLQPAHHTAAGASTAVFGALGLIAAYQWRVRASPADRWLRRLGPAGAGIALLALLGSGDERTDVSAHLTGFLCGAAGGAVWAALRERTVGPLARSAAVLGAVALLVCAWRAALLSPWH